MGWGRTIRRWYGRSVDGERPLDISNDYIGYYTDNGRHTVDHCNSLCLLSSCRDLFIDQFTGKVEGTEIVQVTPLRKTLSSSP